MDARIRIYIIVLKLFMLILPFDFTSHLIIAKGSTEPFAGFFALFFCDLCMHEARRFEVEKMRYREAVQDIKAYKSKYDIVTITVES